MPSIVATRDLLQGTTRTAPHNDPLADLLLEDGRDEDLFERLNKRVDVIRRSRPSSAIKSRPVSAARGGGAGGTSMWSKRSAVGERSVASTMLPPSASDGGSCRDDFAPMPSASPVDSTGTGSFPSSSPHPKASPLDWSSSSASFDRGASRSVSSSLPAFSPVLRNNRQLVHSDPAGVLPHGHGGAGSCQGVEQEQDPAFLARLRMDHAMGPGGVGGRGKQFVVGERLQAEQEAAYLDAMDLFVEDYETFLTGVMGAEERGVGTSGRRGKGGQLYDVYAVAGRVGMKKCIRKTM